MPARGRKKIQSEQRRKKLNQPRDDIDGWREWTAKNKEVEDRVAAVVAARRRAVAVAVTVATLLAGAFYALDTFSSGTSAALVFAIGLLLLLQLLLVAFTRSSASATITKPATIPRACSRRAAIHRDRAQDSSAQDVSSAINSNSHHSHRYHSHHTDDTTSSCTADTTCSHDSSICHTADNHKSSIGMMFRISRLVEAIETVRRSVLDYSYAAASSSLSSALTAPSHHHHALLTDEATVERHKQQQVRSSNTVVIAPAFQPTLEPQDDDADIEAIGATVCDAPPPPQATPKLKKKRKTRGRAESMYSSTVTIEEFTVLPERRRSIASFDEYMDTPPSERHDSFVTIEEYTVLPARRPGTITTPAFSPPTSAVDPAVAAAIAASSRNVLVQSAANPQDSNVTDAETPVVCDDEPKDDAAGTKTFVVPATVVTPKKSRMRRRSKSVRIDAPEDVIVESTPVAVMLESAPVATPVVAELKQQTVAIENEVPEPEPVAAPKMEVSAAADIFDTFDTTETANVVDNEIENTVDSHSVSDNMVAELDASSPSKPRRRRHSRRRSRSSRRSTLSLSERPSSYDEFLLLEPTLELAKAVAPVDKNRELYVTEAARVRALQATPIDSTHISTPAIRLMVDELNAQLGRTHAALAANWDFMASLTIEPVEPEVETEPECCSWTSKPTLSSLDSTEVDDDDDLALRDSELLAIEDDAAARYGDVDYDDHYYAYHSMSTPCV